MKNQIAPEQSNALPSHEGLRGAATLGHWRQWAAASGLALLSVAALAQTKAGEVSQLQGMASAQQPGAAARFLGRGDQVLEGDVLTTTDKGYAVVTLVDGTRFTLRPSTTFALERFAHNQGVETVLMRLFRGGLRMVTGLVGKRNPAGMELRTATATIGIRGTSFDARLCGDDCRLEDSALRRRLGQAGTPGATPAAAPAATPPASVVGRIVQASGEVTATLPGQPARPMGVGAALYEGDSLRTGSASLAVLGLRDQTRISVNPETTLRLDRHVYDRPQTDDNLALALLKGGLRVFTGLMGKKNPGAVTVRTTVATIGIRGTGMDISCEGPCVDPSLGAAGRAATGAAEPAQGDGLFLLTWEGGSYFLAGALDVPLEQAGFVGADGQPRLLATVPDFMKNFAAPRPDAIEVDWNNLFASVPWSGADGVYVYLREGHVFIISGSSRIDLGAGEAGYAGEIDETKRIEPTPNFLLGDPYPLPELVSQSDAPIFQLYGVTLGRPGQEICRR